MTSVARQHGQDPTSRNLFAEIAAATATNRRADLPHWSDIAMARPNGLVTDEQLDELITTFMEAKKTLGIAAVSSESQPSEPPVETDDRDESTDEYSDAPERVYDVRELRAGSHKD